jgi:lipopolysaccharide exporter
VLANPLPEILVTVTDPQVAAGGAAWCERFDPRPLPAVRKLTADAGEAPFFDRVWLRLRQAASRRSLGNVAVLGLGSAIGQGLVVLASPILTRFYDPHDFGLFGSFNAIVTTIIAASTLMFHQAIVIEEADRDSVTSTALCLSVATSFALASTAGALLLYGWLTSIFGPGVAVSLCWLGPISILAAALFVTLQSVCIRRQWFKPLALYQVVRSALVVIFQLSLWIIWPNLYGLIIGQLLGQVLALLVLARVWPFLVEAVSATRHLGAMRHIAVRYSHFAIYGAPQSVLNSLSGNVPTLLLTGFFGANETGLFWLAYRMLILPNQVLVESMRSVLFQRLNEVHLSGESMQPMMRKAALQLAMLCGPIALILLAFGPALFAWVFGPNWARAGTDAQILAISWMLGNVSVPASIGAVILGLQRSYFFLELTMLGVRAIGICIGALLNSSSVALILFSAAAATSSVLLMAMVTVADRRNPTATAKRGEN